MSIYISFVVEILCGNFHYFDEARAAAKEAGELYHLRGCACLFRHLPLSPLVGHDLKCRCRLAHVPALRFTWLNNYIHPTIL